MTPKARLATMVGAPAAALLITHVPQLEGVILRGYRDPIGIVTACAGHTKTAVLGRPYTREECERLLMEDLIEHAAPVVRCAGPVDVLGPWQMAAAVSFTFNVGAANFCGSTFARKLKARDPTACAELSRWVMAGGGKIDCRVRSNNCYGVVDRRQVERDMCEGKLA